jgi:hypothetical protein
VFDDHVQWLPEARSAPSIIFGTGTSIARYDHDAKQWVKRWRRLPLGCHDVLSIAVGPEVVVAGCRSGSIVGFSTKSPSHADASAPLFAIDSGVFGVKVLRFVFGFSALAFFNFNDEARLILNPESAAWSNRCLATKRRCRNNTILLHCNDSFESSMFSALFTDAIPKPIFHLCSAIDGSCIAHFSADSDCPTVVMDGSGVLLIGTENSLRVLKVRD